MEIKLWNVKQQCYSIAMNDDNSLILYVIQNKLVTHTHNHCMNMHDSH